MTVPSCMMTVNGTEVEGQGKNGLFTPKTSSSPYYGCTDDKMYKISCTKSGADGLLMTCITLHAATGTGDISKVPDAIDCGGYDYSNSTYGCSISEKTGDCGTCVSAAPMKSLGVVAIIAFIATLF